MQINIETQPYASVESDALVTFVFDKDDKFEGVLGEIDRGMNGKLATLATNGEITESRSKACCFISPKAWLRKSCFCSGPGSRQNFRFPIFAKSREPRCGS